MPRAQFNKEFKQEAVRLVVDKGRAATSVAADLGLDVKTLYRWVQEYKQEPSGAFPGSGRLRPEDEEFRQLKRRIADLEEENAIQSKGGDSR